MRRRQPPDPPDGEMPERLRRLVVEEWPVVPVPDWWNDGEASWRYFKARLTWQRAVAAWHQEHHPDRDVFAAMHPETAANLAATRFPPFGLTSDPAALEVSYSLRGRGRR
jgi:hypothetical protein